MNTAVKYSVFSFQWSVSPVWVDSEACLPSGQLAMHRSVKTFALWTFRIVVSFFSLLAPAADLPDQVRPFVRVPDLAPSLTNEEIRVFFGQWVAKVNRVGVGLDQKQLALFERARRELSEVLPKATEITFYSLIPVPATEPVFKEAYPQRHEALLKLDRFHECPILGSVTIDGADEVARWLSFLKDQIMPGDITFCDFMPRHGFRIKAGKKHVDILMCFQCDQLSLPEMLDVELNSRPVFSPAVRDVMNALFDKKKIERDKPKKE